MELNEDRPHQTSNWDSDKHESIAHKWDFHRRALREDGNHVVGSSE